MLSPWPGMALHVLLCGAYSNVACMHAPRMAARWDRQMRIDSEAARDTEIRLRKFIQSHVLPLRATAYANAALDEVLADIGGWACLGTRTKWPSSWVPGTVADRVRKVAHRDIPDLLDGMQPDANR